MVRLLPYFVESSVGNCRGQRARAVGQLEPDGIEGTNSLLSSNKNLSSRELRSGLEGRLASNQAG